MPKSSVAIIGRSRLAGELLALGRAEGLEMTPLSDPASVPSATNYVIDTESGAEDIKRPLLQRLDAAAAASTVILSTCLRFTATQMASWIIKPDRLVGFATFYPLKDRKLIELTAGLRTAEPAMSLAEQLLQSLGKATVRVKDAPGLIFPRILSLIINEAARSFEEGVANAAEIDVAMRLGVNYPQGPLKWADQIGLDEVLAVLEGLQSESGDDRYRPATLLKKFVISGFLGEMSGRGFYTYSNGKAEP